jgi:hypothetical protein
MHKSTALAALCALAALAGWTAETSIPICCNKDAFTPLTPPALAGATLAVERAMDPAAAAPKVTVAFTKPGEERRFLALETIPLKPLPAYQAIELTFSARAEGVTLIPAVMLYERGGAVWFRSGRPLDGKDGQTTLRLALTGMRQATFSTNAGAEVAWDQVDRLWFGFLADGQGQGSFAITSIVLTSEPYRPTAPATVFEPDTARWTVTADPAVKKELTAAKDDQDRALVRIAFTFPGGRHMYLIPSQPVPDIDFADYAGLRFTYQATPPQGLDKLLICVNQGGNQFVADATAPANGDWQSVVIPFDSFKIAAWSNKPKDTKLAVSDIASITVGIHGTAAAPGGDGQILIRGIELVPPEK